VSLGGNLPVFTDEVNPNTISVGGDENFSIHRALTGDPLTPSSGTISGPPTLWASAANATGFTINDLRESFQIQKLLERDARGGTRYPEILQSHFRVTDPALLVHQRPVFLGGGSSMINISPVQQTTETDATTPQGNLAAFGTVSAKGHGFTYSSTEHGHIIGLANVRADLTYQQGLERYWSRQTRFDFYWPALSHLGEQATRNSEVFVSGVPAIDDATFSYMPRYDEYRFKQSQITGAFRSAAAASLDVWHLAQDFAALPVLDKSFIEDNPPIDRVVAVPAEPDLPARCVLQHSSSSPSTALRNTRSNRSLLMSPWEIYFASLVAMTLHPGYTREGTKKPSLTDCARIADEMCEYNPTYPTYEH